MGNLNFWIDDYVIYAVLAAIVVCFVTKQVCQNRYLAAMYKQGNNG
jgi:hypothetical protein